MVTYDYFFLILPKQSSFLQKKKKKKKKKINSEWQMCSGLMDHVNGHEAQRTLHCTGLDCTGPAQSYILWID
jgi:hypothetical protein